MIFISFYDLLIYLHLLLASVKLWENKLKINIRKLEKTKKDLINRNTPYDVSKKKPGGTRPAFRKCKPLLFALSNGQRRVVIPHFRRTVTTQVTSSHEIFKNPRT
jgi:hypothetical protein